VGASLSDAKKVWLFNNPQESGYGLTGCLPSMYANQISYWLGVTGEFVLIANNTVISTLLTLPKGLQIYTISQQRAVIITFGAYLCVYTSQVEGQFSWLICHFYLSLKMTE
jgi:hypothetical protein